MLVGRPKSPPVKGSALWSFAVSSICESSTSPTVAAQIKSLGTARAAAVLEAIGRIERTGDRKYRAPDPGGGANAFFNLSVPGVVIQYSIVDEGAAFVVTRVRLFMLG